MHSSRDRGKEWEGRKERKDVVCMISVRTKVRVL